MDAFFIKQNNILKKVPFEEVVWIKAEGNYITINIGNKNYILKTSLKQVLQQLPSDVFLQIHRAYIVFINKINNIDIANSELTIDDQKLPIGKNYRDDLLSALLIVK